MSKNWKKWVGMGLGVLILISIIYWVLVYFGSKEFLIWFGLWVAIPGARYVVIPALENEARRNTYAPIATQVFQVLVSISIYRIMWFGISIAFPEWYSSFSESNLFWPIHYFGALGTAALSQMPDVWYKKFVGVLIMFLYIFSIYTNSPATASSKTEVSHNQSKTYYVDFSKESEFRFEGIGNYSCDIIPDKGSVLVSMPNGESIEITRQGIVQKNGYKKDVDHKDLFGTFVVVPKHGCTSATIVLSYW